MVRSIQICGNLPDVTKWLEKTPKEHLRGGVKVSVQEEEPNKFSKTDLEDFLSSFPKKGKTFYSPVLNDFLREIYFRKTGLGDDEFRLIFDKVVNQTNLSIADFSQNNITEEGAKHFAKNINKVKSNFLLVNFMENPIGSCGLEKIAKKMESKDHIGTLVTPCEDPTSEGVVQEIKEITNRNSTYHSLLHQANEAQNEEKINPGWTDLNPSLSMKAMGAALEETVKNLKNGAIETDVSKIIKKAEKQALEDQQNHCVRQWTQKIEYYGTFLQSVDDSSEKFLKKTKEGRKKISEYIEAEKIRATGGSNGFYSKENRPPKKMEPAQIEEVQPKKEEELFDQPLITFDRTQKIEITASSSRENLFCRQRENPFLWNQEPKSTNPFVDPIDGIGARPLPPIPRSANPFVNLTDEIGVRPLPPILRSANPFVDPIANSLNSIEKPMDRSQASTSHAETPFTVKTFKERMETIANSLSSIGKPMHRPQASTNHTEAEVTVETFKEKMDKIANAFDESMRCSTVPTDQAKGTEKNSKKVRFLVPDTKNC